MPRDDYTPSAHKVSYSTARNVRSPESEVERGLDGIKRSGDMKNSVRRSEMDNFIERREMRRRTRSKTKKRSNRLELRRKRSARRNRSEMNFMDRRENRRAGQNNNRHATLSPTRRLANSSKSPGTTDRENDEVKEQKQNVFTRPPSAFGNAPPGSSAPTTSMPGLITFLCSTIAIICTLL